MPVVFLAAPKAPLRRTVSLGLVQESLGLVQEGSKKDTDGSDLENVISRSREIGTMGLKRKRSSLPRQLSSYFGFEEEEEVVEDVGQASIWYKPSPHPSVSKWPLITSFWWLDLHSILWYPMHDWELKTPTIALRAHQHRLPTDMWALFWQRTKKSLALAHRRPCDPPALEQEHGSTRVRRVHSCQYFGLKSKPQVIAALYMSRYKEAGCLWPRH